MVWQLLSLLNGSALEIAINTHHAISGQQWIAPKKAFRPAAGLTSYEARKKQRDAQLAMKVKEKEMKEEKEEIRQVRIALATRHIINE